MRKMIFFAAALLFVTTAASAQTIEKKDVPQNATVDAWRDAMPQNEQPAEAMPVREESSDNIEFKETPAQIEKRILDLEQRLMTSLKARDAVALGNLLADDFVLAGVDIAGTQPDKTRFIQWALKNFALKSYDLEKTTARAFSQTAAVVTYQYKRQATVAGAPADGDFLVTDVWVKRSKQWRAVSHHISPMPKPQ